MNRSRFFNVENEMEVLGTIFIDNKVMRDKIAVLQPEDFYNTANGIIYNAMRKLYIADTLIDATTLYNELGGNVQEVGGITYISQLIASSVSSNSVMAHCNIVKYKSRRRKLYTALNQCIQDIKDTDIENDNLIEILENQFKDIESFEAKRDGAVEKGLENYHGCG